eukprot:298156-Prorocentrum_minimum.AAC.1
MRPPPPEEGDPGGGGLQDTGPRTGQRQGPASRAGSRGSAWQYHEITRQHGAGKFVNLTDCDELEESIDESCTFASQGVRDMTTKIREGGGDYNLVFWIKSRGEDTNDQ